MHADQASLEVPTLPLILVDRLESEFLWHTFPRASGRSNLLDADGIYPRSVAVGACTKRKRGVTKATAKFHSIVSLSHELAAYRSVQEPYASMQLNKTNMGDTLLVHQGRFNYGRNWIVSFGSL